MSFYGKTATIPNIVSNSACVLQQHASVSHCYIVIGSRGC